MISTLHALALAFAAQPLPALLTPASVPRPAPMSAIGRDDGGGGGGKGKKGAKSGKKGRKRGRKSHRASGVPAPAPPAPSPAPERTALGPEPAPLAGGAPAPPLDADPEELPGDRVPDECDHPETPAWTIDLRQGGGSIQGREFPSGGGLSPGDGSGLTSGDGSAGVAPGAGGARSSGAGAGGMASSGGRTAAGVGPSAGGTRARGRGGDTIRIRLDRLLAPAGDRVLGGRNQGGLRWVQDAFAALNEAGGLLRVNVRMGHPEDVAHAAWQMAWAHEAGLEVLLTVVGSPPGVRLGAGNGAGATGGRPAANELAEWASAVLAMIGDLRRHTGQLPDYLEVWNEPDRPEFFEGDLDDYLAIYGELAPRVRAAWPTIRIGGMGLAGAESTLGGQDSALFALIDHAARNGLPLDFLSWHNYGLGASLRYSRIAERLRSALANRGLDAELIVSEWNLRATPAVRGWEFDGSAAAANLVAFLSCAISQGIDHNVFFMLYDDGAGSEDLSGLGVGALTVHGVKKPVWRTMELVYPMAEEHGCAVVLPPDEYALSALASWNGRRARLVVANDAVEPDWVWTRGCRELGLEPGVTAGQVAAAGGSPSAPPTRAALIAQGLAAAEADAVLALLDRVAEAAELMERPRRIRLELEGATGIRLLRAWRFDSVHNNPAAHREELRPWLDQAERNAQAAADQAATDRVVELGGTVPPGTRWTGSLADLAARLGLSLEQAGEVAALWRNTLRQQRLAAADLLDTLPGASLEELPPATAGVRIDGAGLELELEPNGVIVLDLGP